MQYCIVHRDSKALKDEFCEMIFEFSQLLIKRLIWSCKLHKIMQKHLKFSH